MLFRSRSKHKRALESFQEEVGKCTSKTDLAWCIAETALFELGYLDGIIYYFDDSGKFLLQCAALGPKNMNRRIKAPIRIKLGDGIVGSVAETGKSEIIKNTITDVRYKLDDDVRLSEITVPIVYQGEVLGIIDSEHPKTGYYGKKDLETLEKVAEISAEKLCKFLGKV